MKPKNVTWYYPSSQSMRQIETYHALLVCTKRVCCIKEVTTTFVICKTTWFYFLKGSYIVLYIYIHIFIRLMYIARTIGKSHSIDPNRDSSINSIKLVMKGQLSFEYIFHRSLHGKISIFSWNELHFFLDKFWINFL